MIPKNLKAGDTFIDGKSVYEVIKVNEDGTYSSKRIGDTSVTTYKADRETKTEDTVNVSTEEIKKPTRARRTKK